MNGVNTNSEGVTAYRNVNIVYSDLTQQYNALVDVLQEQAVSVALFASPDCFQHYSDGILIPEQCSLSDFSNGCKVNHAVLAVGYGNYQNAGNTNTNQKNPAYIRYKNSYGENYGDGGYINIAATALPSDYAATTQCTKGLLNTLYNPMYPVNSACDGEICGESNLTSSANSIAKPYSSSDNGIYMAVPVATLLSMVIAFAF